MQLTPNILLAAWQLGRPQRHHSEIRTELAAKLAGADSLPPSWLIGLHHWLRKHPDLGAELANLSVYSGMLWPELKAAPISTKNPLAVAESLNLFIYPSLWRPLSPAHLARLRLQRPDLRAELQALPQVETARLPH